MASLKEVRNRIGSVISTQQITKAMKMVAAAKLRRAQDAIIQMRPYANKLSEVLSNLSTYSENEDVLNPYAVHRKSDKILLVVITSDRGLCGTFNTNVLRATQALLESTYSKSLKEGHVSILTIGKKGFDFFNKKNVTVISDFTNLFLKPSYADVCKAATFAMDGFLKGEFDRVELIYNEFKNVATQLIRHTPFLPIASSSGMENKDNTTEYIFEPSKEQIYKDLIPESLRIAFYRAFLDSAASEQGARMTAMDKATENAGELLKELRLTYNRTRQAAITKEILEIVGGAEALSSN